MSFGEAIERVDRLRRYSREGDQRLHILFGQGRRI